jgi:hypothetical protein
MSVQLKYLSKTDINLCVDLHKKAYPNYLFTSRFPKILLAKFYMKLIEYCEYSYVIYWDEVAVGLIIAGKRSSIARNFFIKENFISLIFVLIKNPTFLVKEAMSLFSKSYNSKYKLRFLNLLVSPEYQSKPITITAVKLFEEELKKNNEKTYGHSVQSDNLKTINFHLKNKCRIEAIISDSVFFFKHL